MVDHVKDGLLAATAASSTEYDAAIFDVMMPGLDGLALLRRLRDSGSSLPVILVSARGAVDERVAGLDAGADDYLAKPFAIAELTARVRALARRKAPLHTGMLRVGDLELDAAKRIVRRGGHEENLTSREFAILECLMRQAGRICSRPWILERVWDFHFDPGSNIVDVYVSKLREKIDRPGMPRLIHSVRGSGYVVQEKPPK